MRVGFVGWRGMVGSVLMQRMQQEGDFEGLEPFYFSTSQVGQSAPLPNAEPNLLDATDLDLLGSLDVVVTCQGGGYTQAVYQPLRDSGWDGYWIDAASSLRLADDAVIVLDPVNGELLDRALERGVRTLVGGNCTVSLMLMAVGSLIQRGWVEWISSMTYQAASGAGAAAMLELAQQTYSVAAAIGPLLTDEKSSALDVESAVTQAQRDESFPAQTLGAALAGNVLPWIDREMPGGQTREEWKGQVECQRILGLAEPLPVDGVCVRVPSMRSHAQALTLRLTEAVPIEQIERQIEGAHEWIDLVPNDQASTLQRLHPTAVTGSLRVAVGRLRKLAMGPEYLGCFTVGDQLLWGAAEPLRRTLQRIRQREVAASAEAAR